MRTPRDSGWLPQAQKARARDRRGELATSQQPTWRALVVLPLQFHHAEMEIKRDLRWCSPRHRLMGDHGP